jgi:hypothetical protein
MPNPKLLVVPQTAFDLPIAMILLVPSE